MVWYLLDGIQLASTDENDVVAEVPLPVAVRHTRHLNKKKHITAQESIPKNQFRRGLCSLAGR
jgi:hypothetical protein